MTEDKSQKLRSVIEDPAAPYKGARSAGRRRQGAVFIDGVQVADTIQCAHCNRHDPYIQGRGDWMCMRCFGTVCGRKRCVEKCEPFEKKLDDFEAGRRSSL